MKKIVSVIVPVYNVEKYLPICIQSIIDQTYRNIEILLVDDGSQDSSGVLCDSFAKKDNRIVVIHKENGGLSSARNVGIREATGDYITFVDSDDYISNDFIEKTVNLLMSNNAQICIMGMKYVSEAESAFTNNTDRHVVYEMSAEQAIEASLYQRLFSCCAPSKMYKKSVIGDIAFPEGRLSEDLATCHLFLDRAEKIIFLDDIGYYYRQRDNSIMHDFNPRRMDALEWAENIEFFCNNKYPRIRKAAQCRTFNVAIHLLLDLPIGDPMHSQLRPILSKAIRRTRKSVIINNKCRTRERMAAILSFLGEKPLKYIWNSKLSIRKDRV